MLHEFPFGVVVTVRADHCCYRGIKSVVKHARAFVALRSALREPRLCHSEVLLATPALDVKSRRWRYTRFRLSQSYQNGWLQFLVIR